MEFFRVAIKMPKSINVVFVLNLLGYFKVIVMVALSHLGLFNFHPPEQAYSDEHRASSYVIVRDRQQTPSLVPVPVVMAWIKKRVPVVEYGSFREKQGMDGEEDGVCSVCLDCIKRRHEIRELSNCSHVFHRECLDTWVDEGQVTCPLCRSMLFPGCS